MLVNNVCGDETRLMSNFNDGSTRELALWILNDICQPSFNVTNKVVCEFSLNDMSSNLLGSFNRGILAFGFIGPWGRFNVPRKL